MRNEGIGRWVERRRERSRGQIAITFRDQHLRYEELAERINRLADALATRGIRHGDRVAYLGNNHASFIEVFFAVTTLGAIFVPINTRLAPPEVDFALDDSGATLLFFQHELADLARAGSWSSPVQQKIIIDGPAPVASVEEYEQVLASGADVNRDEAVTQDDAAMILYTSGTTGHPKGAVLTHSNFIWNTFNVLVDYGVSPGEKVLLISPMFHVASLSNGTFPVLLQGGTVVLHEKFEPGDVLKTIESERITMLAGVPTTYQLLQEHPDFEATDISSLAHLTCGGSSMPERMLQAYEARGLGFSAGYGMTETAPGATALPAHMAAQKMGSSGLKHFFTDVKIVDDDGNEVAPGVVGEILVQGPNVIKEYWNRPDATAAAFVDGWFRSGDLGYFDEDGYIFISDRLKDMIISGGENIYSAEVEGIIMELPQVAAVALVGMPDEKWGEVPVAIAQLKPGVSLEPDAIIAHLSGRLAKYKIPKQVHFVDDLPRTASGKIRKADLRTQFLTAS